MNKMILAGAGIGAALLWALARSNKNISTRLFKNLVPNQKSRACDNQGCGHFNAKRGDRLHQGIDIIANPGQLVNSPITGKVLRYAYPYEDMSFAGIALDNDRYFVKIFYVAPSVSIGTQVVAGKPIGFAQNIAARYPGITPHVHMEVWDKSQVNVAVDPTNLFYV